MYEELFSFNPLFLLSRVTLFSSMKRTCGFHKLQFDWRSFQLPGALAMLTEFSLELSAATVVGEQAEQLMQHRALLAMAGSCHGASHTELLEWFRKLWQQRQRRSERTESSACKLRTMLQALLASLHTGFHG